MTVFGYIFDDFLGTASVTVDTMVITDADGNAAGIYGVVPVESLAPASATALLAPLAAIAERMGAALPANISDAEAHRLEVAGLLDEIASLHEVNEGLVQRLDEKADDGEGSEDDTADEGDAAAVEPVADGAVEPGDFNAETPDELEAKMPAEVPGANDAEAAEFEKAWKADRANQPDAPAEPAPAPKPAKPRTGRNAAKK